MFTGHATDQNRGQVHVDNIKLYPRETRGVQRACAPLFLVPRGTTKHPIAVHTSGLRLTSLPLLPPQ